MRKFYPFPLFLDFDASVQSSGRGVQLNYIETHQNTMPEYPNLMMLPVEHPLRNTSLASIGAETKWLHGQQWKAVEHHWKIGVVSYNDLGDAWLSSWEWRATRL